jgi:hypothetical protein
VGLVNLTTNLKSLRYGKYESRNPVGVPLTDLISNESKFIYYSSQGYTSGGDNFGMKSLKYGNDQLGGGNSGQPYIQVPIPDGFNDLQLSNNDFILRGGALAARDSATDILRLGKMFKDTKSPNGLLFIAKQNLLSRTAVRTQTSRILNEGVYSPLSTLAQVGLVAYGGHLNKQGLNPFRDTGTYSNNSNLYGVKVTYTQPAKENRLVNLYQAEQLDNNSKSFGSGVTLNKGKINIISYTGGPGSTLGIGNTNIRYADGQQTGFRNYKNVEDGNNWFYGPNTWTPHSLEGNPFDTLKKLFGTKRNFIPLQAENLVYDKDAETYVSTPRLNNNVYAPVTTETYVTPTTYANNITIDQEGEVAEPLLLKTQKDQPNAASNQRFVQNTFVYTQGQIDTSATNKTSPSSPVLQDFRKIIRQSLKRDTTKSKNSDESGATPNAPNYNGPANQAYEKRVNIGGQNNDGPGNKSGKNLVSYTAGSGIGPVDKINALSIYPSSNVAKTTEKPVNDLVKFRIAVIDNSDPTNKIFIHFRAFIDNFSDSYNATWNPVTYLGRGENFYTYSNYTRAISMAWTVAAQSKEELIPMYKKLNYLASSLTPYYTPSGYMTGNLVQLTVGGYLYETVGIINSITYDIPEESPWEIGLSDNDAGGNDSTVKELPHIIRVTNFSFTPIQDFIPSLQEGENGSSRYISLADGNGNNDNNYDNTPEDIRNRNRAQYFNNILNQPNPTPEPINPITQ